MIVYKLRINYNTFRMLSINSVVNLHLESSEETVKAD